MGKIVFIGAGSIIFVKNLIGDCLCTPALQNFEYALLDIDKEKLHLSEKMLQNLNENINGGRAQIRAYDDQRQALTDADYVVNAIQVGGYSVAKRDFEIPEKYGLKQTYADTLGIGGIFRGLRTIPVMLGIARDMEELCPNAWLLNYTNPMAIVTAAMLKGTGIRTVGLCHSVQVCARDLLAALDMPTNDINYHIAGINHQAWLLKVSHKGEDLYPEIRRRIQAGQGDPADKVRYEVLKHFGYYVTESSQHTAEYTPYFLKNKYPQLEAELGIKTKMYLEWGDSQTHYWEEARDTLVHNATITHTRTEEYASYIMEAMETGKPYKIGGNVLNNGLIDNLPQNSCVEVPCLVDANGISPCKVGMLPAQCAGLNVTNINVHELVVQAALTGRVEDVYYAAMLDPHTAAELSLDDITKMCDEMLAENKHWLPMFNRSN
ncbi:alpha-glucosidase/alpha-galactosidase [Ruminococcaceae bacterium OttesenSCG-928-A16]|nr:alpha-glucosidase/alpha-galactosidase [Ruminococcaceae bacterium OttesenSCG-928-A16]